MGRPQKIIFAEMRDMGVRGILVYCADYQCSHSIAISGDGWPDELRLSDIVGHTVSQSDSFRPDDCVDDQALKRPLPFGDGARNQRSGPRWSHSMHSSWPSDLCRPSAIDLDQQFRLRGADGATAGAPGHSRNNGQP
jgi:hypothetical protein